MRQAIRPAVDFTARQAPIVAGATFAAVLGAALSLTFGRVCWEVLAVAAAVLAFSAFVGRGPT
jgi:hypothetical protein